MGTEDVILLAMKEERHAQEIYREGAESEADPETRALFRQLLGWELEHERLLQDRLTAIRLLQ